LGGAERGGVPRFSYEKRRRRHRSAGALQGVGRHWRTLARFKVLVFAKHGSPISAASAPRFVTVYSTGFMDKCHPRFRGWRGLIFAMKIKSEIRFC
jgi:hypothetical protein